jgi:broad specificity phosphatase PhoE
VQIVLVRHGQSTNNAQHAEALAAGLTAGSGEGQAAAHVRDYPGRVPDPALSVLGVRQARALASAVVDRRIAFAPTHLYASATMRAVQTAQPLAEVTGLPVVVHPDAHEVGGIHLFDPQTRTRQARPGATLQELREHCPSVHAIPGLFDSPDQPWHGGIETEDEQALPRAKRFLAWLVQAHRRGDVVLVVSHQYFAQFVVAAAFGRARPPWRRFRLDNTGHLSLRLDAGSAFLDWVNRLDHLDPTEVTN